MRRKSYHKRLTVIENPKYLEEDKRSSLKRVADKLVEDAMMEDVCGCPTRHLVKDAIRKGTEIPERAKPGRAIMRQSKELRKKIKKLKPKHFNDRFFN